MKYLLSYTADEVKEEFDNLNANNFNWFNDICSKDPDNIEKYGRQYDFNVKEVAGIENDALSKFK